MNDLERNFIEGAARAMYVQVWADHVEQTCVECGNDEVTYAHESVEECERNGGGADGRCGFPSEHHTFQSRGKLDSQELMAVVPPTPDYARHEATKLLGRLEQANPQWGGNLPSIIAAANRACELDAQGKHDFTDEQVAHEFGHCIAMEALGHGVSWFDDHADFELNVPHVEFELEEESTK